MQKNIKYHSSEVKGKKGLQSEPFSMIPDRYWKEKWYLKPNHHRIFNYLIYQAKWADGGKSIGRFSIGTYQLAELFGIPQKTVHRTLQDLSKLGEITLQSTSKFTIITVLHLRKSDLQNEKNDLQNEKNDLQNEVVSLEDTMTYEDEEKIMTYENKKVTYKTEKVTTPIDIIDKIDNKYKNEINFVENKFINNKEEKEMVSKKKIKVQVASEETSVKAAKLNSDLHDKAATFLENVENTSVKANSDLHNKAATFLENVENTSVKANSDLHDKAATFLENLENISVKANSDLHDKAAQVSENLEKTSVKTGKAKPDSFIETLLEIWRREFKLSRNFEYIVIEGKDKAAISKLLQVFKKQNSTLDSKGMEKYFETFFKQSLAIDDQFIFNGINPAFIYSQINRINTLINKSRITKSYSSVGQAPANGNYNLPLK